MAVASNPREESLYPSGQERRISEGLIRLAMAGDRNAQQAMYDQFSHRIYRLVQRMVGSSDAEDVAQNAFIQIFIKLDQFRNESSLETWIHRLAVNESLQFLRKRKRKEQLMQDYLAQSPPKSVSESTDSEQHELLEKALQRLDAELRTMIHLKEYEGFGYRQIAEVMGIPEGTVGSRLNRARRELRTHLQSLGWEA